MSHSFHRHLPLLVFLVIAFTSPAFAQPPAKAPIPRPTPEQQRWIDDLKAGKEVGLNAAKLYYAGVKPAYPLYYDVWSKAEPDLKIQLLGFIANRKMPRWEEALHASAAHDAAAMRVAAFRYFHYLPADEKAIDRLQAALGDADREVRWHAASALARMPEAVVALEEEVRAMFDDDAVEPLLLQPLLANIVPSDDVVTGLEPFWVGALIGREPMVRMAAAEGLQRLRTFDPTTKRNIEEAKLGLDSDPIRHLAVERLLKDLGAESDAEAGAAMYCLVTIWNPEIAERVAALLKDDDLRRRARAAEVLRKRKIAFDPAALRPVFEQAHETTQLFVCGTLGRVQTAVCAPVVALGLASKYAMVRRAAIYSLENLPADASGPILVQALRHAEADVRRRASIVLGRRGDKTAVKELDRVAVSDADLEVREAARRAVAIVGGRDLATVLVDRTKVRADSANRVDRKFDRAAGAIPTLVDGVYQLRSHKQLFVDDLIVESIGTAKRVVHPFKKDPRNPVFEQEYPWERQGTLNFVSSVHYDPEQRLFTAWYHSMLGAPDGKKGELGRTPLIAYSADGIHWQRPLIGEREYAGSKVNNVVGMANNIVPLPTAKDPAKRYAGYLYHPEKNAMAVAYSADGISGWSEFKGVCGGGRDVVTACRDDLGDGYFSFMKWRFGAWNRRAAWAAWGSTPDAMTRGPINITADLNDDAGSADRIAAAYPTLDFVQANQFHTEIYEVTPFIYEGHYFGLSMRFDVSGKGGGNVDGITDVTLISSRDKQGKQGWQRPGGDKASGGAAMPSLLTLGKWGEWDSGQIYGPNGLLVVDDEIVFYYTGACFGHEPEGSKSDGEGNPAYRAAIGRATLRLDGLVSLQAGSAEATMTTKLVSFTGKHLQVNAACPQGALRVELVDALGKPIPGFAFADCDPFTGDALRHIVSWHGRSEVSSLAGKTLQVRFQLRNGDLYAMQFVR
jgi:HEAT repeat protein